MRGTQQECLRVRLDEDRAIFIRLSKIFQTFRRRLCRFACLATPEMGLFRTGLESVVVEQLWRSDKVYSLLVNDVQVGPLLA